MGNSSLQLRLTAPVAILTLLVLAWVPRVAPVSVQEVPNSTLQGTYETVDLNQAAAGLPEDKQELESLLHWAIEHSDPDALHAAAQKANLDNGDVEEVRQRRQKVQELIQAMKQEPTETDLMKEAIAKLAAETCDLEEAKGALQALQYLVEPIDNANDLNVLGGLEPIVRALEANDTEMEAGAAYVIGIAASNNVQFQKALLEACPEVFYLLVKVARTGKEEAALKALYALSALVRNAADDHPVLGSFYGAGGVLLIEDILTRNDTSPRLKKKALNLITNVATVDPNAHPTSRSPPNIKDPALLNAVVGALRSEDVDLQERALHALKALAEPDELSRRWLREHALHNGLGAVGRHLNEVLRLAHDAGEDTHYIEEVLSVYRDLLRLLQHHTVIHNPFGARRCPGGGSCPDGGSEQ